MDIYRVRFRGMEEIGSLRHPNSVKLLSFMPDEMSWTTPDTCGCIAELLI